jgi:hypothetical protein
MDITKVVGMNTAIFLDVMLRSLTGSYVSNYMASYSTRPNCIMHVIHLPVEGEIAVKKKVNA